MPVLIDLLFVCRKAKGASCRDSEIPWPKRNFAMLSACALQCVHDQTAHLAGTRERDDAVSGPPTF